MNTSQQLGEEKISSLLFKFSLPAIVAMLVNAIYNVVDRMFIGRLVGPEAFAGAFVAFPIILIVVAFGNLAGFGGASLTSIRLGQKKEEEAKMIFGNSFLLSVILAVLFTGAIFIFMEPILRFFGSTDEIMDYSKQYMGFVALGFPFQIIAISLNSFMRALGKPKLAMSTMLIGAIANIIMDALFMYVLDMGIIGAAIATSIAQVLSFTFVIQYFLSKRAPIRLERAYMVPQFFQIRKILALGMTQFSIQLLNSLITLIYNRILAEHGGAIAISTYGIISSVLSVIVLPVFGLNQGSQPIVGYNYGAENYDRVKATLKLAIKYATIFTTLGFIVTQFFTTYLVQLFTKDPELINAASHGVRKFFMMFIIVGFQIVSSNYFQAKGLPLRSFILSISRQGLILVPALFILSRAYGLDGIWYAAPLADAASAVFTGAVLFYDMKKMNQMEAEKLKREKIAA